MKKLISILFATGVLTYSVTAQTDGGATWRMVSAGSDQTYAIQSDGTLWAWGCNLQGELGNGTTEPSKVSTPIQVGTDKDWKFVNGGNGRGFFLKEDGTLWSVGTFEGGVLGNESSANVKTPKQIDGNWATVATSTQGDNYAALAIKNDGTLWGWGNNKVGAIGTGSYQAYAVPVQIGTDNDWVAISMGRAHSLALKKDGSIWGCGEATLGALGKQSSSYCNNWVKVADADNWNAIYAIDKASYALKEDGTLWAWGENYKNLLGLELGEEYEYTDTPTKVTAISEKVISFSGSQYTRVAVVETGENTTKAYAWGYNAQGSIGNGTGVSEISDPNIVVYTTPQEVKFDESVKISSVTSGQLFSVVLTSDGKLYGWGTNSWGQLGTSETDYSVFKTTPVKVASAVEPALESAEFDAKSIPASLANAEKIILIGEWSTADLKKINAPLGNGGNATGFTYNNSLKIVDMSKAAFAGNTSFEKVFFNCQALETVIFPDAEAVANIVSLHSAFLNDIKLTSVNVENLINVKDLEQAFQNCKELTELNLSKWNNVEQSEMAVQNCAKLTSIALPGKFTIDDRCFGGCDVLSLIDWSKYEGTEAPTFSPAISPFYGTVFAPGSAAKITLIVPDAAYASFTSDPFWKEFNVQKASSGIEDIISPDGNVSRAVYNISGQYITTIAAEEEVNSLPAGLYIIGGKKVLVK